jgi:glutamate carboxypeptidase
MSIPVSTPAEPLDLQRLLAFCETERPWLLETIQRLVELESPTSDKSAVDAVVTELALGAGDLGGRVSRLANGDAGDHLRAEFGRGARQVLLLGHVDTVWPIGQLSRMPLRLEEGRLHGPGVFDMKAGIALGLLAVRALQQQRLLDQRKVVLLLTADEETGSRTSRAVVEAEAEASDAVLVLEPALPDGGVKTSRKGVGEFVLEVHGRAAHAGLEPERGVSAIVELAHQVLGLQALSDHAGACRSRSDAWQAAPGRTSCPTTRARTSTCGSRRWPTRGGCVRRSRGCGRCTRVHVCPCTEV